jgi:hypothetical protein
MSASDKAKESLAKLHDAVAEELLSRITSGDATPADLSVAVKFLKDNDITAALDKGAPVFNLAMALPFAEPRDALEIKGTAIKEAVALPFNSNAPRS